MLKFTLILPADDGQALQLLREAINDLSVILMIIVGPVEQWVRWADALAAKGTGNGLTNSFRRVVWSQQPGPQVLGALRALNGGQEPSTPYVIVLNFHDKLVARLQPVEVSPLNLEEAFLKGN
jgi:hypothetical protein